MMNITAKPKTVGVTSIKSRVNRPSIVLSCVSGRQSKQNYAATIANRDYGFWTVPAGSKGDSVMVGDEYWFYSGKDAANPNADLILSTWVVTEIIECGTTIHAAICESWTTNDMIGSDDGLYSNRRIVVLGRRSFSLAATFQDLLDMFCKTGSRQLPAGNFRARSLI